MTNKRKDEMQKIIEEARTWKFAENLTDAEIIKIVHIVQGRTRTAPPMPHDVAEAINRLRCWLTNTVHCEDIETLIRAASTPSADIQTLAELHEIIPATPLHEGMTRDIVADAKRLVARRSAADVQATWLDKKAAMADAANVCKLTEEVRALEDRLQRCNDEWKAHSDVCVKTIGDLEKEIQTLKEHLRIEEIECQKQCADKVALRDALTDCVKAMKSAETLIASEGLHDKWHHENKPHGGFHDLFFKRVAAEEILNLNHTGWK